MRRKNLFIRASHPKRWADKSLTVILPETDRDAKYNARRQGQTSGRVRPTDGRRTVAEGERGNEEDLSRGVRDVFGNQWLFSGSTLDCETLQGLPVSLGSLIPQRK